MKQVKNVIALVIMLVVALMPLNLRADEFDDAKKLAEEAAKKFLGDINFVKNCMSIPESHNVVKCDAADLPGWGLVCPPPPDPTAADHHCTLMDEVSLEAALGTKSKQLIKLSGSYSVFFSMIGQEKSIPAHIHTPNDEITSCQDKYIKRTDQVKVVLAAYQKGALEVSYPVSLGEIDSFLIHVGGVKSKSFQQGPTYFCSYIDHPNPRSCYRGCSDVEMVPDSYPVMVPPGGSFGLTGIIGNPTNMPIQTEVWVGVMYQNNFYQLWYFPNIPLGPFQYAQAHLNQSVPHYAPFGTYDYVAYSGRRSLNLYCDSAKFQFTVAGARIEGGKSDWSIDGNWVSDWKDLSSPDIPSDYELSDAYPNPFNAQTNIAFGLPHAAEVTLSVFNILGQRVRTLIDGRMEAGFHSVVLDAGNLSSGLYFYKLKCGDKQFTKRLTLLK